MEAFEFQQLFPDLQWEVVMKMKDRELVNLCRSSKGMENFCNTRNWFWKARIKAQFNIDSADPTIQNILNNNGNNWFRVYFVLIQLTKLKQKLSPHLDRYSLTELYNLRNLSLINKQLTELPTEIGQLVNLLYLYLNNNQLKELPTSIGNLTNLRELSLNNNQLTELPTSIGQLVNLRNLNLNNNQLTELPTEIGQLVNLIELDLSNNQLSELPTSIGQLVNLLELNLNENQLRELPAEIGSLINLIWIGLENNPLQFPYRIKRLLPRVLVKN